MRRSAARQLLVVLLLCLLLPILSAANAHAYVLMEKLQMDSLGRVISSTIYGVDNDTGEMYSEPGGSDPNAGSLYLTMTIRYGWDPATGEQPVTGIEYELAPDGL